MLLLRCPETDVLGGQADNVAVVVDDASAGTASSNIDADVVVCLTFHLAIETVVSP